MNTTNEARIEQDSLHFFIVFLDLKNEKASEK